MGPKRFELSTSGFPKMFRALPYKTGALTRLSYGPTNEIVKIAGIKTLGEKLIGVQMPTFEPFIPAFFEFVI